MEKNKIKKCIISKYDETITEPPFLTIKLNKVDVFEPDLDDYGQTFATYLRQACYSLGYIFKFYTTSSEEGFDYELIVY